VVGREFRFAYIGVRYIRWVGRNTKNKKMNHGALSRIVFSVTP
jgi:hypothetical protein